MSERRYADPAALRRAVTDRLRALARERPHAQLEDLQRQFVYDRLLCRVFLDEPDAWVLKGATALLARLRGAARHSLDIDLYRPGADLDAAEAALHTAAAIDIGDFFRFTLGPGRDFVEGQRILRIPITAYLGATEFARFHVDLVAGLVMTGQPDKVPPLISLDLPGIRSIRYLAYPMVDHVADKVCAMLERHPRAGGTAQASTRYRDLVDLALIAHTQRIDAGQQEWALESESGRRGIELPASLPAPGGPGWPAGYARVARHVPGLLEQDIESAIGAVRLLIDPILARTAKGSWEPRALTWTYEGHGRSSGVR